MRLPKAISPLASAASKVLAGAARSAAAAPAANLRAANVSDGLVDLLPVADNPGKLHFRAYVPDGLAPGAALVVVLHGCTQTAADYDRGSGWSQLADRHGFALLYPEQTRANNPNVCFNWFSPGDVRRGGGEVASIHAQVVATVAAHALDPARVFVTGLSAGGAMTAALLATYPETFAAGAIIAGLPYGSASGVSQALDAMRGGGAAADAMTLGDRVRAASPYAGSWPRVSIWHGDADHTVVPANGDALVRQWTNVHGLSAQPALMDDAGGVRLSRWARADGTPIVEHHLVGGMAHGTPLDPGKAGRAQAHMLDVGISSTDEIAAFFGLALVEARRTQRPAASSSFGSALLTADQRSAPTAKPAHGPQKAIEDALRAAGLMR